MTARLRADDLTTSPWLGPVMDPPRPCILHCPTLVAGQCRSLSMKPAVLFLEDLPSLGEPVATRPVGAMAPHIGRQFSVAELDDEDKVSDDERPLLALVRAYEVPSLVGATFTFTNVDGISKSLGQLLAEKLPGIAWRLKDEWAPAFSKYQLVHATLAAPPDLATGQTMSLEIFGQLWWVDGVPMDTPAGQAWKERQVEAFCNALAEEPRRLATPSDSTFVVRLEAATYANVQFPGVGVPFYM
jgi:hypothetical protein